MEWFEIDGFVNTMFLFIFNQANSINNGFKITNASYSSLKFLFLLILSRQIAVTWMKWVCSSRGSIRRRVTVRAFALIYALFLGYGLHVTPYNSSIPVPCNVWGIIVTQYDLKALAPKNAHMAPVTHLNTLNCHGNQNLKRNLEQITLHIPDSRKMLFTLSLTLLTLQWPHRLSAAQFNLGGANDR